MPLTERQLGIRRLGTPLAQPLAQPVSAPVSAPVAPVSLPSGLDIASTPGGKLPWDTGGGEVGAASTLDTGEDTSGNFSAGSLGLGALGSVGLGVATGGVSTLGQAALSLGQALGLGAARQGATTAFEGPQNPGWAGLTTVDSPNAPVSAEFAAPPGMPQSSGPGAEGGWSNASGPGVGVGAGFSEGQGAGMAGGAVGSGGLGSGTSGTGFDVGGAPGGADSGGGDGGGGGGGCIVCTTLHGHGLVDPLVFNAITAYGRQVDPATMRGYHLWGKPLARFLDRSPTARRLLRWAGKPVALELAHRAGMGKSRWLGRTLLRFGVLSSIAVGTLIRSSEGESCTNCKSDLGWSRSGNGGVKRAASGHRSRTLCERSGSMPTEPVVSSLGPRFPRSSTATMNSRSNI